MKSIREDDRRDPWTMTPQMLQEWMGLLSRTGKHDECTLAQCEHQALRFLAEWRQLGKARDLVLAKIGPIFQDLITAAERNDFPLSDETEDAIRSLKSEGATFVEGPRRPSRPMAMAPKQPMGFSVFVDESGSASFDEQTQPMACVAGVVVRDDAIPRFEQDAIVLLAEYGLTPDIEVHAHPWLSQGKEAPTLGLTIGQRRELLYRFLTLGTSHATCIHHLTMAKARVSPAYRKSIKRRGFDAYTHTVLWFALTLDRGLLPITMPAGYKYFYDEHSSKVIPRIFQALMDPAQNPGLRLIGLKATPHQLDSRYSRLIQLADVVAYYLNRYRDFEVPALTPRPGLEKHEERIREIFSAIQPKLLDFISKDLHRTINWESLANFTIRIRSSPPT